MGRHVNGICIFAKVAVYGDHGSHVQAGGKFKIVGRKQKSWSDIHLFDPVPQVLEVGV